MAEQHIILGAAFRSLGAHPAGWRVPGAHNDPRRDAAVLRRTAKAAEAARLDYLFVGDWLSTGLEFEESDPYLLARVEPLTAIAYLAAVTRRIGLITSVNTTYSDPYTLARQAASIDLLSDGRLGVNLHVGADARAAANFGSDPEFDRLHGYDRALEYVDALRLLWDSWSDDAFVADADSGRLVDLAGLQQAGFFGEFLASDGPLNVLRPPQGQVPLAHAGTSARARELVATRTELAVASFENLAEATAYRAELRAGAEAAGRSADDLPRLITPLLPVVAETTSAAHEAALELTELVPVNDLYRDGPGSLVEGPTGRSVRTLSSVVGTALGPTPLDTPLTKQVAARFGDAGQRLVETVAARTGGAIGGHRPITYRQLLATHLVAGEIFVGDGAAVADRIEHWFLAGAVDGFQVLSAYLPAQFEGFTELVVPELQRRDLFRTEYRGRTLREHLGLPRPERRTAPVGVAAVAR